MGREHELAALVDAHARAQPDGGLAVIEGEAGIGRRAWRMSSRGGHGTRGRW